jgi:hypothetical protein
MYNLVTHQNNCLTKPSPGILENWVSVKYMVQYLICPVIKNLTQIGIKNMAQRVTTLNFQIAG